MRTARRKGFTLIETVSAIVILSVAVPPMLWAVTQAQRQRMNPIMASKARWLAVEKLEDIIADRHAIPARGWGHLIDANYPDENPGDIGTGYEGFSRKVTPFVAETDADLSTPGVGYQVVTVTVGWTTSNGDNASLSISTVLTNYTP